MDWKKFGKTIGLGALEVVGQMIPAIGAIETVAKKIPGLKGRAKEDAVIELVRDGLMAAEGLTSTDLLDDAEVDAATRSVVSAIVHLDNVIALKKAQRAAAAAGTLGSGAASSKTAPF